MHSVMCSVVAKVYQLWGAARGSFWEVGGGEVFFCYFGVFQALEPKAKQ